MTADKLMKAIRGGKEKLRLDQLVIVTPTGQLTGKGMLRIEKDELHVDMTLDEGMDAPKRQGATVVTVEEFWTMSGVIENNLPFHCNFGPCPTRRESNGFVTLSESVGRIQLGKQLWRGEKPTLVFNAKEKTEDAFPEDEDIETLNALLNIKAQRLDAEHPADEKNEDASKSSFEFHAWVADYELREENAGSKMEHTNDYLGLYSSRDAANTLRGETDTYTYAIIQALVDDRKDLCIILRSKDDFDSPSEEDDQNKFEAFLNALSLTHGKNAWPYRIKYWRDYKLKETVSAIRRLPHTPHSPFSGMGMGSGINLAALISRIATQFEDTSAFTKKLRYLLFLSRQAGDSDVQHEIGTLGICSVFDGLVDLLFDHFKLKQKTVDSLPGFAEVQQKLLAHLDTWPEQEREASYSRFRAMIKSASMISPREKLEAICSHMGLKWESGMKEVCLVWQKARNPLAHGKFKTDDDPQDYKDLTYAESKIAGGLNTLLLKLFGYSGYYNSSVFEPGFTKMEEH